MARVGTVPRSLVPLSQLPAHLQHWVGTCLHSAPVLQPFHCRSAVSCSHSGRHYYFANKTCPALPGRQAVRGDFLQTAVLIVPQDSCKLQSQRVALPVRGNRVPCMTLVLLSLVVRLRVPPPTAPRPSSYPHQVTSGGRQKLCHLEVTRDKLTLQSGPCS